MIRRSRTLLPLLAPALMLGGSLVAASPKTNSEQPTVAVVLALQSERELRVPWHSELTIDRAIQTAARKPRHEWKEAWRYRESFWTRNFRNPHSFWARLFAGEKATGYSYFQNAPGGAQPTALRPGDKIYVDLAPVF